MQNVISILGQKGGVGKSTVARLMAVRLQMDHGNTVLCDTDPNQGTAVAWKERRDRNGYDPDIEVIKCRSEDAAFRYAQERSHVVIDTPAFLDKRSLRIAQNSTLTVLPTGFGEDDLRPQLLAAYELLDKGIDAAHLMFAFCRAKGSTGEYEDACGYLRASGVPVAPTPLRELPSIRRAHNAGLCASEVSHKAVAANAIDLATEIGNAYAAAQSSAR